MWGSHRLWIGAFSHASPRAPAHSIPVRLVDVVPLGILAVHMGVKLRAARLAKPVPVSPTFDFVHAPFSLLTGLFLSAGPPVGCADANSVECPASVGGCCPIGQLCYRDSGGVARCDSSGLFSSSAIDTYAPPTTTHTTPIVTYTTTAFTPTTPTSTSRATVAGSNQPVIVTVKAGTRKSAQLGACMLALVSGAFFLLT